MLQHVLHVGGGLVAHLLGEASERGDLLWRGIRGVGRESRFGRLRPLAGCYIRELSIRIWTI
jgi:hypothetical protein